jgi:signal peptide peptidase SppA
MPAVKRHAMRHLIAQAVGSLWAIDPERLDAICEVLSLRRAGMEFDADEIAARLVGMRDRTVPHSQMLAVLPARSAAAGQQSQAAGSSVAVLSILGTIVPRRIDAQNASGGGFVSAEAIATAFREAVANPDVGTIVLDLNSPGGAVAGIPELAAQILEARGQKRIIAVANHLAASAAYWIAASATEVVASPSADVGSVGVLAIHQESSAADTEAGIKTTVFRSVAFKAELNSVEPLTAEAAARLQARLAELHQTFLQSLATGRNLPLTAVAANFGQGRTLSAAEALAAGMIDRIATLDEVLAELLGGKGTPGGVSPTASGATARPSLPLLETLRMDPAILTALIRSGAITAKATPEQAESARHTMLAIAGCAADASVADQVAAIASIYTATSLTPTAQPITAVVAPVAPVAATTSTAPQGVALSDAIAMVRVSNLSAADQLAVIADITAQAGILTAASIVEMLSQRSRQSNPSAGLRVEGGEAEVDKFQTAARDAILGRAFGGDRPRQIWSARAQDFVDWKPGRQNHHLASLPNLARQSLIVAGFDSRIVGTLADADVARLVMGAEPADFGFFRAEGAAYNGRAQFTNLLFDAANVMLRRSYAEQTATFTAWARQGESVRDFKPVHKVIAGELSDPQAIPENGTFEETALLDGRESYALTTWGERFSISWQTIVDDRLAALTDIPSKQGAAMRRKQNRIVYQILKDNAALSDNVALFHANHGNLTGTGTAISVTSLNVAYALMAKQTGLNSSVFVAVEPRFLLAPPAIRGTALQLLNSTSDPSNNNSGTANIWSNGLTPIIDVELSAAATGGSDTAWYLAGANNQVDTVEYAYLQGLETPAFERQTMFDRLAVAFRVYQCFAAKALDFRGLYKNNGA